MLTNRLVRALIGAVVAQASVAAAWYVYNKEQKLQNKKEEKSSDDMNALDNTPSEKVHDLTPAIEQVEAYIKAKEDLKTATNPEEVEKAQSVIDSMNVTVYKNGKEVASEKTKPVRKPRVAKEKVPNETTVAAMQEAEQIVQDKKTRRTKPVKKELFVAPEAAAKPARKRTPATKKADTVVEAVETKKPARKRAPKKV